MRAVEQSKTLLMILLLLLAHTAFTKEVVGIKDGDFKLVVFAKRGQFIPFVGEREENYVPFFDPKSIGSATRIILVGKKRYLLKRGIRFKLKTEPLTKGVRFIWRGRSVEIIEEVRIVSREREAEAEATPAGFEMTFVMRNLARSQQRLGLIFVADAYREKHEIGFFLPGVGRLLSEKKYTSSEFLPEYWAPFGIDDDEEKREGTVKFFMVKKGVSPPNEVFFANWENLRRRKRIVPASEAVRLVSPRIGSDIAVRISYAPQKVESKATREIKMLIIRDPLSTRLPLSPQSVRRFAEQNPPKAEGREDPREESVSTEEGKRFPLVDTNNIAKKDTRDDDKGSSSVDEAGMDKKNRLAKRRGIDQGISPEEELAIISRYIVTLSDHIESGEDVPPEKIALYEDLLRRFERRKKAYEQGQ